jgi:HEAT repeat protein
MNASKSLTGLLLCALVVWTAVSAGDSPPEENSLQETFEKLLPGMKAEQPEVSQEAQQQWQEICFAISAPGRDAERTEACRLMAAGLDSTTPASARVWLLKQLERIGGEECVDALGTALDDEAPQVVEAARRALANNPSARAGDKLRRKLQATTDASLKVGVIHALNFRAEPESLTALADALSDRNSEVRAAAADALGRLGTAEAAKALTAVHSSASGDVRFHVGEALLLCADKLLNEDNPDLAASIYKKLSSEQDPLGVRQAALYGQLRAAAGQAASVALELLAGDDVAARQVAAGYVRELDGSGIKTLADGLPELPAAGQITLLRVLGARRDRAALPAVVAAVGSKNEQITVAALTALGGVGDVSTVPLLIDAILRERDAETGQAADRSLAGMFAEGVDEAILEKLKDTQDAEQRKMYLQLLVRRRAAVVVPTLLTAASNDDPDVRRLAVGGLSRLAGADDVSEMIQAMWKTDGEERDNIEKAIVAVCQQITVVENRADPVIEAYRKADGTQKRDLFLLLGRLGGPRVLEQIRQALASRDPSLFEAGLNGLANWPDGTVAGDLLELAKTAKEPGHRIRAIRSLARVAVLPSGRSEQEKLAMLKEAMQLAERDEERSLILERAGAVRDIGAVHFALPYLESVTLADQAAKTILSIAHRTEIREPNQDVIDRILKKVIATTQDEGLADRARSYMSEP